MPELRFIPNEAGEGEGFSDAGIETYRADPFPAVARETSQNSRDAHDKERCTMQPVRLVIDRITIPINSLPGLAAFREAAARCLAQAQKLNSTKEIEFFSKATRLLQQAEIDVLRIADYNTTGLRGPCEEGTAFHSLVKSAGVSSKENDTSGGSFGIGKSAVYSASDLQTAYYSTRYLDTSGVSRFLAQGKTRFRSFTAADGQQFRSIGYWGKPDGFMPVEDAALVPQWLRREEIGTTVCSIAVREADDWQRLIAASLIMNFFRAIQQREMEFSVDGDLINDRTLTRRFDDLAIRAAAPEEEYGFARAMFECVTSEDSHESKFHVPGAGQFRLHLLVREGLPKRVGIIRNGMYICDNLGHFGDRLARFAMHRDFVAVVEPADHEGNAWLRAMENPRHDEFSPERLLDPNARSDAKTAGRQLSQQIRSLIRAGAHAPSAKETDLEELSVFFALDDIQLKDDAGQRNVHSFRVQPNPPRPKRSLTPPKDGNDGRAGGGAQEHGAGSGTGGSSGGGAGGGSGGTGPRLKREPFPLTHLRSLVPNGKRPTTRRIIFTPMKTGVASLRIMSVGLNESQVLPVIGGEPRIECVAGRRVHLEVEFSVPYEGPIELVSWTDAGDDS